MRNQNERQNSGRNSDQQRDERGRSSESNNRGGGRRNYDSDQNSGFGNSRERASYDQDEEYGGGNYRRGDDGSNNGNYGSSTYENQGDRFGTGMSGRTGQGQGQRNRGGDDNQGGYSGSRNSGNAEYGNQGMNTWQDRYNSYENTGSGYESERGNDYDFGRSTNSGFGNGSWGNSSGQGSGGNSFGSGRSSGMSNGMGQNNKADGQSHRGKGPKGYQRSDERIEESINDRLTDDHELDASSIEVSVQKGEVTLTGTVPDRFSKRRAEDLVENVSGVTNVENRLRVSKNESTEKENTRENGMKSESRMTESERPKVKTNHAHA